MTKRKILREMAYRDRRRAERRQLQSVVLSGWSASLIDQEVRQGTWLDPYMAILKIPIRFFLDEKNINMGSVREECKGTDHMVHLVGYVLEPCLRGFNSCNHPSESKLRRFNPKERGTIILRDNALNSLGAYNGLFQ